MSRIRTHKLRTVIYDVAFQQNEKVKMLFSIRYEPHATNNILDWQVSNFF